MTRTYTTTQLKKMKSKTDWNRVRNMSDADIDYSDSPDVTELIAKGQVRMVGRPKKEVTKRSVNLRLDPDVVDAFKKTGSGWQTRINNSLREWLNMRSLL